MRYGMGRKTLSSVPSYSLNVRSDVEISRWQWRGEVEGDTVE